MSIAGGLFNQNNKKDDIGDTRETSDGQTPEAQEVPVDLTTALPGFEEEPDEGLVIPTDDVESVSEDASGDSAPESDFDFDPDSPDQARLDPES